MPANLDFGNRSNPAEGEVDGDGDDAHDPEDLAVIFTVVAENNGEDDATQVARCTRDA